MDTIITNARVLTMDDAVPHATGFVVRDAHIAAVGDGEALKAQRASDGRVIDLGGRTVVPGFVDAHSHFGPLVLSGSEVDVQAAVAPDIPAIQAIIGTAVAKASPGAWIRGFGYADDLLVEKRHPTRWELDEVAPSNPVILIHWGYHRIVANSAALQMAGIDRNHPEVAGGVVQRDASGELTGLLTEAGTNGALQAAIDAVMETNRGELDSWVEATCREHLSHGITSIHDAWVSPKFERLFLNAAEAGRLPLYYSPLRGHYEGLFGSPAPWLEDGVIDGAALPPHIRRGGIKLFASGVWENVIYYSQEELNQLMGRANARGLTVAVHVSSDAGTEMAIQAVENTRRAVRGEGRVRLEHFFSATDSDIARMKDAEACVVTQPAIMWRAGGGRARLMKEGVHRIPIRSLDEAGVVVSFSSDAPCFAVSPLVGVASAMERRNRAGDELEPAQAISAEDALRMYTLGAAYADGCEDVEGSIAAGKLANFAVLSRDPRDCSPEEIRAIAVDETWVDGEQVYERGM